MNQLQINQKLMSIRWSTEQWFSSWWFAVKYFKVFGVTGHKMTNNVMAWTFLENVKYDFLWTWVRSCCIPNSVLRSYMKKQFAACSLKTHFIDKIP